MTLLAQNRRSFRGERGWIEWIQQRTKGGGARPGDGSAVQLGIGDDCAVLRPASRHDLLVTTDFCLEGRHFRRDWHPPESAGHRTLARGLSDLAAMGARPMAAFLSLALPGPGTPGAATEEWIERFLEGLLALADHCGVPLAGGDTSQAPGEHVLADVVLLGSAPAGTALRRSGARPGDALYVTGRLGGAAAELSSLGNAKAPQAARSREDAAPGSGDGHPQLYPEPRLAVGQALRDLGVVTACMDLSDGLSTDLAHLCTASGVHAEVWAERLPHSPWLLGCDEKDRQRLMLHGGEDYELLFTAPARTPLPEQIDGVPITRIGLMVPGTADGAQVVLRHGDRTEALPPAGWEHLRG